MNEEAPLAGGFGGQEPCARNDHSSSGWVRTRILEISPERARPSSTDKYPKPKIHRTRVLLDFV